MSRRSEKVLYNRKTKNLSISRADRPKQLNVNACEQTQNNITSRLESIGSLIIDELKGSKRDRLKQQLLTNNLPFSSSKRNLEQVLTAFHTFDCHTQREYRTIGVGDNDTDTNITIEQSKNDGSQISTPTKRKTRQKDLSEIIDNETKKTPNIIPRTICTRSSTLNTLNKNQNQLNDVIPNQARKRRSTVINNLDTQNPITHREDGSVFKVSRKKLQSSIPSSTSIEYPTNDF